MKTIGDIVDEVVSSSNSFERNNSIIKLEYLKENIEKIKEVFKQTTAYKGSFGTGYPFDSTGQNFEFNLPLIEEQIRYNEELTTDAKYSREEEWKCTTCLVTNYHKMPDLKQICKPCPSTKDKLKPRKMINRLPDLDLWIICENSEITRTSEELSKFFQINNLRTSDIDPLRTIKEVSKISKMLEQNKKPDISLPIDVHIVDEYTIQSLLCGVYEKIKSSENSRAYLPIHPQSLRKTWQKDDVAYNFIFDYLSSFTLFEGSNETSNMLDLSRKVIATNYDNEQLYEIMLKSSGEAHQRRYKTPQLKKVFERKIDTWRNI